tara:strand:- start:93 stop:1949 length:1857 start_codon:yes stop_codon:yes gene_type:complete
MANKFTKEKIDFDVYERQDPASQVDWGKAAADITKTVAGIRDERIKRKGEIDKAFEDQQTALTDIGKYDNVTLQQLVMNGYQDAANKTTDIQNLVRRGLMKPSEAKLFRHNTMTGMNLLKKNAVQYDVSFKDYTERLASGEGAAGEEWGAGELEGFANINDLQVQTDPVTGNVVQLRVDPETGEPIPGESLSVQHMTVLLNQRMDAMDMTAEITNVNKAVGDVILAQRNTAGITDILTSQEMTRLSAEYLADDKNKDFLNAKIDLVLQDPFKKQDMLVKNVTTNGKPDGESYYIGKQETHDQWNKDNPGQEELNPVLVMGFGDDSQRKAEFTEAQDKRAKEHVKVQLIGAQDYKEDIETKKIQATPNPRPSAAEIAKGERDTKLLSKGKNLLMSVSGDPTEAEAGMSYLVDASNGQISSMKKTETGFIVTYPPDADGTPVDPYEKSTEGMTPEESMRAMWKASGLQDSEFDAWLAAGGDKLLEGTETTRDPINAAGPQKGIKYDAQAKVTNSDGQEVSVANWLNKSTLGESLNGANDSNDEVKAVFTELLTMESFFPKGLGSGSVRLKGDKMWFTIGGTEYALGDVFAMETAEVGALMQEKIQEAISTRSDGGNASKY